MESAQNHSRRRAGLLLLAVLALLVAPLAGAQAIRIMPMGDSWTSGYGDYVSYRYDLWFDLVEAGYDVDFVGGKVTTAGEPNPEWYPNYLTTFDPDNEGYSGYRTDQLARYSEAAAANHRPDIVLLWTGANDIWFRGPGGVDIARAWLREIIFDFRSEVPGVTILLALNPPYSGPYANLVGDVNRVIAETAADLDRPDSPIILVDLNTGYDIDTMSWDGVHQNLVGERWVADRWFDALAAFLPESGFVPITGGHSGAWYNPATSGQGQFLDVVPEDEFIFLGWFTYTDDPAEQHWYTAQGNYAGVGARLDLYETLGGKFDDDLVPETNRVGSVTINFTACDAGRFTYTFDADGRTGTFPLARVVPGSENYCAASGADPTQAVDINPGMDGGWYDPATAGQGFFFDAHQPAEGSGFFFASWFTYGEATASGQRWLTAQGGFENSTADLAIYETTGGRFDDPQTVETVRVGEMTIDFSDCNNALLSYSLDEGAAQGDLAIVRVVPGAEAICRELTTVQ